jgi:hypothetical protein
MLSERMEAGEIAELFEVVDELLARWDNYDPDGPVPIDEFIERARRAKIKGDLAQRPASPQVRSAGFSA